ncbi:ATP-binding cassette domain-containing protein [Spirosoma endophyticum]|uniref:Molybdate transport system ATP-binding protein n=1 Tax=Spirosoma endophyticum TaxID=662367 RepID=A0A1I1FQW5_9BACT|nr:ATP-binding cassette domain-containing protein [Spirosoma endophyticum]SFB99380.1 molybdate transport system ATP-binding protein [Spirosoma endophyticum]
MIHIDITMPRLFAEGTGALQLQVALAPGSLTAVVGPSGSGKTTLLRVLAGLETPPTGRIDSNGTSWFDTSQRINLSPQQRSIGYVFQDTALFPNMSVRENIQYAAPSGQRQLADELIDATGLNSFINKKPTVLSGGQRQRVALARALVRRPQLLLLDEPFAALDPAAAQTLRQVLLDLHRTWGTTTLLVSHHDIDVQALADRVIRLVQGQIQADYRTEVGSSATFPRERIRRIDFEETHHQWVIETETTELRSTNPAWGQLKIGDLIEISWTPKAL